LAEIPSLPDVFSKIRKKQRKSGKARDFCQERQGVWKLRSSPAESVPCTAGPDQPFPSFFGLVKKNFTTAKNEGKSWSRQTLQRTFSARLDLSSQTPRG